MEFSCMRIVLALLTLLATLSCGKTGFIVQEKEGRVIWRYIIIGEKPHDSVLLGADVETFRETDLLFSGSRKAIGKDKSHVYLRSNIIPDADPESFRHLDGDFFCDDDSIYFHSRPRGTIFLLEGADPSCFKVTREPGWSRCDDIFYLYEEAIYPSSPTSFTPLPKFPWAKDDTFYYYEGRRIENADYSTFEILEKGRYNFARDKDHYYWEGWRLDDVDYHSFEIEHGAKGRDSKYVYKFKKKESARDASGSEYMDVIKKGIKRDAPNQ